MTSRAGLRCARHHADRAADHQPGFADALAVAFFRLRDSGGDERHDPRCRKRVEVLRGKWFRACCRPWCGTASRCASARPRIPSLRAQARAGWPSASLRHRPSREGRSWCRGSLGRSVARNGDDDGFACDRGSLQVQPAKRVAVKHCFHAKIHCPTLFWEPDCRHPVVSGALSTAIGSGLPFWMTVKGFVVRIGLLRLVLEPEASHPPGVQ